TLCDSSMTRSSSDLQTGTNGIIVHPVPPVLDKKCSCAGFCLVCTIGKSDHICRTDDGIGNLQQCFSLRKVADNQIQCLGYIGKQIGRANVRYPVTCK